MPLYEYRCKKCGHCFEKIRKFSDKQLRKCPECGGVLEQLVSASSVRFKGSGWYVTDYPKKGSSAPATSSSSESDSGAKETKEKKEAKKDDKPKPEASSKKHKKD
jgi:putative FmdB family regulatory protein